MERTSGLRPSLSECPHSAINVSEAGFRRYEELIRLAYTLPKGISFDPKPSGLSPNTLVGRIRDALVSLRSKMWTTSWPYEQLSVRKMECFYNSLDNRVYLRRWQFSPWKKEQATDVDLASSTIGIVRLDERENPVHKVLDDLSSEFIVLDVLDEDAIFGYCMLAHKHPKGLKPLFITSVDEPKYTWTKMILKMCEEKYDVAVLTESTHWIVK